MSWLLHVMVLWNDDFGMASMLSVAAVVKSSYCKLKEYTRNFSLDVFTVFPICSCIFIEWLGEIAKIFLTRPNFLAYHCKNCPLQIPGVGFFLAAWKAWAEDIFVRTVVLKVASSDIVTAAWMKYWLVVFSIFGLHETMVIVYMYLLRFRIKLCPW